MTTKSKEVHLVARPEGDPTAEAFAVVDAEVPPLGPGQILVQNEWMSVDPSMRGRMRDLPSYLPPFELNRPMEAMAVGTVRESRAESVPVGSSVLHRLGWREYSVLDGGAAQVLDTSLSPAVDHLGVLGYNGLTAYAGLKRIGRVQPGDVVLVSGAAGGVGTVAGVVARKLGASRVIGSAGGPDKVRRLVDEFGYDAAIDYQAGGLRAQLTAAAPDGVDVYFDNVGGAVLRAALAVMRRHGRVVLCGQISSYSATAPLPGPDNLGLAIARSLTLQGFLVFDHQDLAPEYIENALTWMRDGSLRNERTVVEGIDRAADAFIGLLQGANTGKMLVRISGGG